MSAVTNAVALSVAMPILANAWAAQPPRQVESVLTGAGPVSVDLFVGGLEHPWALAFLPDGRLLVTERPGRLRIIGKDGRLSDPVAGTPDVFARGQGGLLDVALAPDFADDRWVYLSYAKPGPDGKAATALGRGRLEDDRLVDFQDIFVQSPWIDGDKHFGSRIVFAPDGNLFLALGERFQFEPAQDLGAHLGKIVRLRPDGSTPMDNPFVGARDADGSIPASAKARPEIWSYGHRNIEAAAIHPQTGELWVAEMGPLGGDELNRCEAGRNYGWPLVSWGRHYDGRDIPDPPTRSEFVDAVKQWTPVISPSGMIFYAGDVFDAWRGRAMIGGLSCHDVVIVTIEGAGRAAAVTHEERIPLPDRIRDVEQGPDGLIYLAVDNKDGAVWRIRPLR